MAASMITKAPVVCVLMASYNGSKYIREQINSILKQKNVHVKLFIRDDCSTDDTYDTILEYSNKNSSIQIINSDESSGSAARNFYNIILYFDNFDAYDYVAFADQDDIWNEDKLSISIDAVNKCNADACSGNYNAFWRDERRVYIQKSALQKKYDYLFESAGAGCTYLIKSFTATHFKNYLDANKSVCFSVTNHDWLIYAYARSHGMVWTFIDYPLVDYRQHSNNVWGVNKGFFAKTSRLHKILTGWYLSEVLRICIATKNENIFNELVYGSNRINVILKNIFEFRRKKLESILIAFILIFNLKSWYR